MPFQWFELKDKTGSPGFEHIRPPRFYHLLSQLQSLLLVLTGSVVAAAALLAEGPEQRGDVSQDAVTVLNEEANELTHLRGETPPGYIMRSCTSLHVRSSAAADLFSSFSWMKECYCLCKVSAV